MLTVIRGGDVYAPALLGRADVLIVGDKIGAIGACNIRALDATGVPVTELDATGCVVTPGLIDPHQHLIGAGGESGFNTQTPEIRLAELVAAGTTTVVGCLGVETTTKTMAALLARAKALNADGLTAWIYSGGYNVPPTTLTDSLRTDLMIVHEVIGAGEIAIADRRCTEADVPELARLVKDTAVAGMLSGKAGVTHFHVGDRPQRLAKLRALLDEHDIDPASLYPTHVARNADLLREAIALTARGVTVDIDVAERDLAKWVKFYFDSDADRSMLTASSDASLNGPGLLLEQLRECVCEQRIALDDLLPLVTANTARVLKLAGKGRLGRGADADVLILDARSLELRSMIARGRVMLKNGRMMVEERWLKDSDRRFEIDGKKAAAQA
jgi:beta-aspartyl-dipeptidase (metallo-type)